eukprot:5184242-Amphidinium_carterae.1
MATGFSPNIKIKTQCKNPQQHNHMNWFDLHGKYLGLARKYVIEEENRVAIGATLFQKRRGILQLHFAVRVLNFPVKNGNVHFQHFGPHASAKRRWVRTRPKT